MKIENLDTHAVIKWRLTDSCNFDCPYCIRKPLREDTAKDDNDKCMNAIDGVKSIAIQLYANTGKKVKVDLIGGEISILPNVDDIIAKLLEEDIIEKVNITTNFERDITPNKKVTITASYHPTQTKYNLDEWFERVEKVKDLFGYFKVETVYTKDATHIDAFIEKAKEIGVDFQVEEDLFDESLKGKGCSSVKKSIRYRVTDDEGVVKEFSTRNSFLKQYGYKGSTILTNNILCSRDFDYVYIIKDEVTSCYGKTPIYEFKLEPQYHPCCRAGTDNAVCTLCGNISVKSMPMFLFGS